VEIALLAVIVWLLWSRRRERRDEARERPAAGGRRGSRGAAAALRDVILPDGRPAVEVRASRFEPDTPDAPGWTWVALEDAVRTQEERSATLREAGADAPAAGDPAAGDAAEGDPTAEVHAVLVALGGRRRVTAVDVYGSGGRLGHLPAAAVDRYGAGVRRVRTVDDRLAGVRARFRREDGLLAVDVLLPDGFALDPPR
jgi:hypothetical protein